jgi:hypothetical protein
MIQEPIKDIMIMGLTGSLAVDMCDIVESYSNVSIT